MARQSIKIVHKKGLAAIIDKFFPEKEEENKKVKSLKDISLKEEDEDIRDKKQS